MTDQAALAGMPRVTRLSVMRALGAGMRPLRAVEPMRLSAWASRHFVLSAESSHARGGWEAFPFQVGLLDWMGSDDIEELSVRKAKRVGYTKCLLASIGFDAAHRRRKQALWQPTDDDRDSFVKTEVEPMLRDVTALRKARALSSAADDTIKLKSFLGCVAHFLGGKAARAYRRITVAASKLDEVDAFDQQIEKSADPITLAHGRLEGAPFPKLIAGTTPRIKNLSHIEHRERQADALMVFHIDCRHCGVEHPLLWGGKKVEHGFKWDGEDPSTVRHVCPHCRASITQADYLRIAPTGRWVDVRGGYRYHHITGQWLTSAGMPCRAPRHVAAHVWTAYSPQRAWTDIVREWLEAVAKSRHGDVGPMQGFVNETLGETWEVKTEGADEHELARRPQQYDVRTVPPGCLVLAAGIDVQDNRFEIVVWGFGRGEEMWVIDYTVISANPADERDWAKLDAYLESRFPQVRHGGSLAIEAAAIDTGGHFTHAVYNFARARERRRVFAIKGSAFDGRPIKGKASRQDVNWRGTVIKRGVRLWEVGTDTAKDLLHGRLSIDKPGPGYVHFPRGLPTEFFAGLTAEGRALQRTATGQKYRWVKRGVAARNEPLDCSVYALFAAQALDLHRYTGAMWDRLAAAVEPPADLFSAALGLDLTPPAVVDDPQADDDPGAASPAATPAPTVSPPRPALTAPRPAAAPSQPTAAQAFMAHMQHLRRAARAT